MTATKLPDADWLHSPGLNAVINALSENAAPLRVVGGAVRDSLLGLPVADVDLATPLTPQTVTGKLENAGIKVVPTGIEHGTVTAVSHNKSFEITTLRRDVSTDGRRATVAFSSDWREDAARRDFTINALYADPITGDVLDFFGGIADLKAGRVRFIGDPKARIAEDHLRILRFFRFFARFGKGPPDSAAIAACAEASTSLMALSRERIADELIKLLSLPHPGMSVGLMVENGIFQAFLPEIAPDAPDRFARLLEREAHGDLPPDAGRRLSALFPQDRHTTEQIAARLKLSNRMRNDLAARLAEPSPKPNQARALAYRYGQRIATDIFVLYGQDEDWEGAVKAIAAWDVPVFPVKGGELVARGLIAGPAVAEILQAVERQWVSENFPDAPRARAIADQLVAEKLSDKKL